MGQMVDDIMKDIKAISYYMYHNGHGMDIEVVGFLPLEKILQKHLEPQKKVGCNTIPDTIETQQEDKKIELINIKLVEGGELWSPISRTDMCNKINEIITYLNNR